MTTVGLAGPARAKSDGPREVEVGDVANTDLEIWMKVDATDRQIARVRKALRKNADTVAEFAFLDKQAAYEEFKRIFAADPDLVAKVDPDALPTSFRVVVRNVDKVLQTWVNSWRHHPGVDDVSTGDELQAALDRRSEACRGGPADLEAFLAPSATPETERQVGDAIQALPGTAVTRFVSHPDAYRIFRCLFKGDRKLVRNVDPKALPTSYQIVATPETDLENFRTLVEAIPGVDTVNAYR